MNIKPFKFWCQKVLPLAYDDSISYYELLCKVVDFLNDAFDELENITSDLDSLKNGFEELKKYVDTYFDNLDLQNVIDDKIDSLIQTGAFQEMLFKAIGVSNGVQIGEYLGTRYIRMCSAPYNAEDIDYTKPAESEGMCQIEDKTIVTFYSPFSQGITETSEVMCEEYNFTDPLNPVRVRSVKIANLQHANGATYYDGKIYAALWGYYNDGTAVPSAKIGVVDYKTLSLDKIVNITNIPAVQKITVDKTTGKFYGMNGRSVYEINMDTFSARQLFTINVPVSSSQGMEARGGILYVSNGCPFGISVHSLTGDGSVLRWVGISNYDSCDHYFGRIGDIALIGDELYVTTHQTIEQANYGVNPETNPTIYANYFVKIGLFGGQYEGSTNSNIYENNRCKIDTTLFEEKLVYSDGSSERPMLTLGEYLMPHRYTYRIVSDNPITYRGVLPIVQKFLSVPDGVEIKSSGLYMKNAYLTGERVTSSKHYELYGSTCALNALTTTEKENNVINHSTALFDLHDENVSLHTATIRHKALVNSTQLKFSGGQSKGVTLRFTNTGVTLNLKPFFTNLSLRFGISVNINGVTESTLVNLGVVNKIKVGDTEFTITPDTTNLTLTFSSAPVAFELWLI